MHDDAETHLAAALEALGFSGDPEMANTPRLLAGLLREFLPPGPPPALSTFEASGRDLIVLRDLPYYSLCAHHLLPFFGAATVAYVPSARIAGLGSFPRLLDHFARQPQLQERLGAQLADHLEATLSPVALGVRLSARQLCMEMRGARSPGVVETVVLRGAEHPGVIAALRGG
jgi:GTP cyclohydrolase I